MDANKNSYRLFDFSEFSRTKNWGKTLRLEGLNDKDLHIAFIEPNSQCSVHKHNIYNFILNISGILYITFPEIVLELEIQEYQGIEIAPNILHQFYVSSYTHILESYYKEPISVSYLDIERISNA